MEVLLLGHMKDMQTGMYVAKSFKELGHTSYAVDTREIIRVVGNVDGQNRIIEEIERQGSNPDLILIFKGLELTEETMKRIKEYAPNATVVNWFYDKFLVDKPIWESSDYLKTLDYYDYYFCSLKGVADKLQDMGYDNVKYLDEGCYPEWNGEVYMNNYQKKKYRSDVSFIGSIGYNLQHPNRIPILQKIAKEGFDLRIYGNVADEWKRIPAEVRQCHTQTSVVNKSHSKVVQSCLVNLGIDQDPEIELGHSARLYRVLCAGGCYLTTYVKGLENMFNINLEDEEIRPDQDLVVFYDKQDLVSKLDYLLEHQDVAEQIGETGRETVLENHTFKDRCQEMIKRCGLE